MYWVSLGEPSGSAPALRHPHVVIQNDVFNQSKIRTVLVCLITSQLRRAEAPGNVLLDKGEANLTRRSVVNVSQLFTVDKGALIEKIGSLGPSRMAQVLEGLRLITEPTDFLD